jgi:hypothetical protein
VSTVERAGELPGGLTVWRARGLMLRLDLPLIGRLAAAFLLPAIPLSIAYNIGTGLVAGAMLFVALTLLDAVISVGGVRATASTQPALVALVADTATRLGMRAPNRTRIVGRPRIVGVASLWRQELVVGLPLLQALSSVAVRAIVAHEICVLNERRPRLVTSVLERWDGAMLDAYIKQGDPERVLREFSPFATEVHRRADAAAIAVCGAQEAARAYIACDAAETAFYRYVADLPRPDLNKVRASAIEDIADGWHRILARGVDASISSEFGSDLYGQIHPGLASALKERSTEAWELMPPQNPVPVQLTKRQRHRLARMVLRVPSIRILGWVTFAKAPATWWAERAATQAANVRREYAVLRGQPQTNDVELVGFILAQIRDTPPDMVPPTEFIAYLVEDQLLRHGWRLEHPAVRGVLVGPRGERFDASTLVDAEAFRSVLAASM